MKQKIDGFPIIHFNTGSNNRSVLITFNRTVIIYSVKS